MMEKTWLQRGAGWAEAEQGRCRLQCEAWWSTTSGTSARTAGSASGRGWAVAVTRPRLEAALEASEVRRSTLRSWMRLGRRRIELLPKLLPRAPAWTWCDKAYAAVDSAVEAIRGSQGLSAPSRSPPARSAGGGGRRAARREAGVRRGDLQERLADAAPEPTSSGQTAMRHLREGVSTGGRGTPLAVSARGESGTGKSVLAAHAATRSAAVRGTFAVDVISRRSARSCGERNVGASGGRFTGAVREARGSRGRAEGGARCSSTRCEMPPRSRPSCCGFQDKQFERVGGPGPGRQTLRIVARRTATWGRGRTDRGNSAKDLPFRLNVFE